MTEGHVSTSTALLATVMRDRRTSMLALVRLAASPGLRVPVSSSEFLGTAITRRGKAKTCGSAVTLLERRCWVTRRRPGRPPSG